MKMAEQLKMLYKKRKDLTQILFKNSENCELKPNFSVCGDLNQINKFFKKKKKHDCLHNLSSMIFMGNQMVNS